MEAALDVMSALLAASLHTTLCRSFQSLGILCNGKAPFYIYALLEMSFEVLRSRTVPTFALGIAKRRPLGPSKSWPNRASENLYHEGIGAGVLDASYVLRISHNSFTLAAPDVQMRRLNIMRLRRL